MTRLPALFLIAFANVSYASSHAARSTQQSASQTVLHAEANNVVVDVVVTDKGKPVTGIQRSRFHVFDNGKEENTNFFEEHEPAPAKATSHPAALPPHFYTNLPEQPVSSAVNVLLLDALNTPMANQVEVRRQMIHYLGTVRPGAMMAVFTLASRLRMIQGFTTDSTVLVNALKSANANPYKAPQMGDTTESAFDSIVSGLQLINAGAPDFQSIQSFQDDVESFQLDHRTEITMEAMRQLARYLSAVPGRKNLIWFSGSFPIFLGADESSSATVASNYMPEMRNVAVMLAAARVAVYPMDATGLATPAAFDVGNTGLGEEMRDPGYGVRFTQEEIAYATGGQPLFNNNGFAEAVANVIDTGSHYYTLAYAPDFKRFKGEFRNLKVRVDNCGDCQLSYRNGYYAEPPGTSSLSPKTRLTSAALHGAPPSTQVLFQTRVLPATDPAFKGIKFPAILAGDLASSLKTPPRRFIADFVVDPHTLQIQYDSNGTHQLSLEFALIAYDADGRRVNYIDRDLNAALTQDRYTEIMASGLPVRMEIDVPSAPTFLVIAVHDRISGRVGSLEIPLPLR